MNKAFATILLLLLFKTLTAQTGYAFSHINTDDGTRLGSNFVTSMHQDEKGFVWVGTANGLQRFDGSKFIYISSSDMAQHSLIHARISQIIPLDSGRLLLAGSSLRELGVFDPEHLTFSRVLVRPKGRVSSSEDFKIWRSRNDVFLIVHGYGLMHFESDSNAFVDDSVLRLPANVASQVNGLYEDVLHDWLWLSCNDGLHIYDNRSHQLWSERYNPRHLAVLSNTRLKTPLAEIFIDHLANIWALGTYNETTKRQLKLCLSSDGSKVLPNATLGLDTPDESPNYKHFFETHEGDLWLYGDKAMSNRANGQDRFYVINSDGEADDPSRMHYRHVFQLVEDREKNLWIATDDGIYYTVTGEANNAVMNVTFFRKSSPNFITDIAELPGNILLYATQDQGVMATDYLFNKVAVDLYKTPPPENWMPASKAATRHTRALFLRQSANELWIGCKNGVLMIYSLASHTTRYLQPAELDNGEVKYITEDKQGNLWLATENGRLIRYSNGNFTMVQNLGTIIYKVFVDDQNWLWLATKEQGLYAMRSPDGAVLQHYTADSDHNSLYSNTGFDVEQLKTGQIVYGAGAINIIDKRTGKVSIVSNENGLPSNTVSRIRSDDQGYLWIITTNGLCRYNPVNGRITSYNRKDGVVNAEKTGSADYRTANGDIIFGGFNTVVMFSPKKFLVKQKPADVIITDFKLYNQYLPVDSLTELPYVKLRNEQNSLTISFASLSYRDRDKLTYYYKMEGVDKDWIQSDRSYLANYSLLQPGSYTFSVYCENIEGIRSPHITSLKLYIKPPFYRTLWFLTLVLMLVAIFAYIVHDMRVNKLLAVETLRNRVARDLHDDMGSTLSTINILSSMAKTKMQVDTTKTTEYIEKISEYSERMMDAMDDIVWSIKPSNDSMQKITARMREFATNVLEAKEIDFDFKIDEEVDDVKLNMEARRDFFLVFKEAVNNAAKYSKANKVTISLTMQSKKLVLLIKDDGIGFNIAAADGNGLGNMKKRADNINASVSITSTPGNGTTVRLMIPIL